MGANIEIDAVVTECAPMDDGDWEIIIEITGIDHIG